VYFNVSFKFSIASSLIKKYANQPNVLFMSLIGPRKYLSLLIYLVKFFFFFGDSVVRNRSGKVYTSISQVNCHLHSTLFF
jgi:hypothetical protein